MNQLTASKKPERMCHFCGYALKKHEVAAYIWGEYADYEQREKGCISLWV